MHTRRLSLGQILVPRSYPSLHLNPLDYVVLYRKGKMVRLYAFAFNSIRSNLNTNTNFPVYPQFDPEPPSNTTSHQQNQTENHDEDEDEDTLNEEEEAALLSRVRASADLLAKGEYRIPQGRAAFGLEDWMYLLFSFFNRRFFCADFFILSL